MKHLQYSHSVNRSLVETMTGWILGKLPSRLRSPNGAGGARMPGRFVLTLLGWLVALAVQAALIVVIAELVEIIHGVMNLYLDLAQQQLDLTSLYAAATSPQ